MLFRVGHVYKLQSILDINHDFTEFKAILIEGGGCRERNVPPGHGGGWNGDGLCAGNGTGRERYLYLGGRKLSLYPVGFGRIFGSARYPVSGKKKPDYPAYPARYVG